MKNANRRDFIKKASILSLQAGIISKSNFLILSKNSNKPVILGGEKTILPNQWVKWPIWDSENDEKILLDVMRSGVWSRAKTVSLFEEKWANLIGSKRCLTVVNGTNALIIALNQSKIQAGDEVIVTPYTFIATIQAILANGAIPIFVDVDPTTFQMDPTKIEAKISQRTKAIMPVHILGLPCDMPRIMEVAKKHQLIVIEDACQAPLAAINHQHVGTFGKAGCFSFQNSKNIAIGEGGAIISNDEAFMDACYSFHNLGLPYGIATGSISAGSQIQGNKLRFSEYQAAIGLAQLSRLEEQTAKRNENANYLTSLLKSIDGIHTVRLYPDVTRAAYHLYPFRYDPNAFKGLSRAQFLQALDAEGVPCSGGYTSLNTQPFLKQTFESSNFKKMYSSNELNYTSYMENNQCPLNNQLCNEAVWFTQNLLLGTKNDMELIDQAIQRIHAHADQIKKKLK
ncbi:DegT/DnrJ/EryC1/StrS family aminotransferase [Aquirufa rosea]|uniref:DegT/DnrJ/EryC1/StrS family aminotransferase n=1 Tax=Aquirufa rosea TaxID=2509241 RepID=A0A4Q1C006_9BACT|nr:DegT/DnrJ/EryC1/StrS family aminotransferase [Aquirufa rosea]RXK49752.1 DegT/DnrJ/EryC1/StrS family aminotransferase [Aquirufa rosea]